MDVLFYSLWAVAIGLIILFIYMVKNHLNTDFKMRQELPGSQLRIEELYLKK